jgi:hypothetical protein
MGGIVALREVETHFKFSGDLDEDRREGGSLRAVTARPGAGGAGGDDLAIAVGEHALEFDVLAVGVSVLAEQDGERCGCRWHRRCPVELFIQ